MASLLDTLAGSGTAQGTVTVTPLPTPTSPPTSEVSIIQYDARIDPQAEAFLPWMWKRMQEDDLVDYYFPGQKDTGFATFVRLMSGDAKVGLFKTELDSNQWEDRIAGFITWSPTRMGASDVIIAGFIFFRKFWDHHTTDAAGAAAFDYWFRETPVQVVMGVCPALHATAMRYNKRIGLQEIGRIPRAHVFKGETCDAVLVAITRESWTAKGHN